MNRRVPFFGLSLRSQKLKKKRKEKRRESGELDRLEFTTARCELQNQNRWGGAVKGDGMIDDTDDTNNNSSETICNEQHW
jgi:hypothetical protein